MSREKEVAKTLGGWLGKAKAIGQPPETSETSGSLNRPERGGPPRDDDQLTQLNFKISPALKKRIKQLAVRDNITLLTMLDQMVALYEKEHGKLGK